MTASDAMPPTTMRSTCCCGSRTEVTIMTIVTRSLVWLATSTLLTMGAAARADEPDAASREHAQRIAITVCGTCHGPNGNSVQPKYPRLAGQNAHYLAAQLKAFRAQTRGDPDAI